MPSRADRVLRAPLLACLFMLCLHAGLAAQFVTGPQATLPDEFVPAWSAARPARSIEVLTDPRRTPAQRGAELAARFGSLQPGDQLLIRGGTYSLPGLISLDLPGREGAPIWITAQPGERVILTRADASQNVINIGRPGGRPASYIVLQGLEVTGGSQGIRLLAAHHVWIDGCRIHHTGEAGLTANSGDTSFIALTRNEISFTNGTGEGFYLGANNAQWAMSRSLIALNHVHHTGGSQGDGIELKQGSWGNRIVGNLVHDTLYPCIIVYGTGGRPINVIERNVCRDSGDNVLQVQGEALVANNLLVGGAIGLHSHDHQGLTRDLRVVHNTIITTGPATDLVSWNDRPGMVFANNAVCSLSGLALSFPNGSAGVRVTGNVVTGGVSGVERGFVMGAGRADFLCVDGSSAALDAHPTATSMLRGAGDAAQSVTHDLTGALRQPPLDAGCFDAP